MQGFDYTFGYSSPSPSEQAYMQQRPKTYEDALNSDEIFQGPKTFEDALNSDEIFHGPKTFRDISPFEKTSLADDIAYNYLHGKGASLFSFRSMTQLVSDTFVSRIMKRSWLPGTTEDSSIPHPKYNSSFTCTLGSDLLSLMKKQDHEETQQAQKENKPLDTNKLYFCTNDEATRGECFFDNVNEMAISCEKIDTPENPTKCTLYISGNKGNNSKESFKYDFTPTELAPDEALFLSKSIPLFASGERLISDIGYEKLKEACLGVGAWEANFDFKGRVKVAALRYLFPTMTQNELETIYEQSDLEVNALEDNFTTTALLKFKPLKATENLINRATVNSPSLEVNFEYKPEESLFLKSKQDSIRQTYASIFTKTLELGSENFTSEPTQGGNGFFQYFKEMPKPEGTTDGAGASSQAPPEEPIPNSDSTSSGSTSGTNGSSWGFSWNTAKLMIPTGLAISAWGSNYAYKKANQEIGRNYTRAQQVVGVGVGVTATISGFALAVLGAVSN